MCVSNLNNRYVPFQNGCDVVKKFYVCYLFVIDFVGVHHASSKHRIGHVFSSAVITGIVNKCSNYTFKSWISICQRRGKCNCTRTFTFSLKNGNKYYKHFWQIKNVYMVSLIFLKFVMFMIVAYNVGWINPIIWWTKLNGSLFFTHPWRICFIVISLTSLFYFDKRS